TFFYQAWLDFTGRDMSQELGDGWSEGVHAEDFERCLQTYVTAFDRREAFSMQYRLRNSNGQYSWVTDNSVPRYGPKGNFRGYIGACVDVTDLLEKERALGQIEDRVALAAEVAHLAIWELETRSMDLWVSDNGRRLFGFPSEGVITYERFRDRV